MNDQPNVERTDRAAESASPSAAPQKRRRSALIIIAVVAIALISIVATWLLWPKQAGKPVPAPRTVSFQESPQTMTTAEQRLTLTPEQLHSVQLKIETVGEAPSTEAAGQMATGVVQANNYKETPVMSLVGGIVRNVSAELGQSVKRGQRVAVIFSNELADAQARYLTAAAVLDEHHRHHMRTAKLVEIGAASRQELEMATSQLRDAESNLANLRQKLMLLGLSAQRIDSLNSTSQISSEVNVQRQMRAPSPAARLIPAK
jgi:multidrug efflux pump subunit AcrA (membrane-fusion protein)